MEDYYSTVVKYYSYSKIDETIPFRENAGRFEKSIYDRYLSAMYINLFETEKLLNGNDTKPIEKVLKEELYNQNSNIFKLNLYPLAKRDTGWSKDFENRLQISKKEYYGKIFDNRKIFLKTLVNVFKPEVIICTSTNEYKDEFIEAFFNSDEIIKFSWNYLKSEDKSFKVSTYKSNLTTIIIIPFLGRGNLSSYNHVINMSNYIKENILN